ncbi:hypothetical protein C1H46_000362 [Malus baccata]|uniref:Bifunctional inhibitor/plant lipid transfer protein/seed storage helical domain-containing protein n=1 Tax=Malus baccata TaxID=106549 RepID=A0A540NSQ0_MALBA|nr:hypothetical protein C1H46_000362 [Malus baccata]
MASKRIASLAVFLSLNLLSALVEASPNPNKTACPRVALKLGVCANVLSGLVNVNVGQVPLRPCCSLLFGLVDLEAAVCLCTAIKANILGININIPIAVSLLLSACGENIPKGFQCP